MWKHLYQSVFFIQLQPWNIGVFILWNLWENLFLENTSGGDAFVRHKPRLSFFIEVFEYDYALDQGC